jgi:hypothetical protein
MAITVKNQMNVYGNIGCLESFKARVANNYEKGPISFQNILPAPVDYERWDEDCHRESSIYKWHIKHWGTPYDAKGAKVDYFNGSLIYSFYTRWTSPYGIIDHLIVQNKDLDFKFYNTCDCDFNIEEMESKNGKLIKHIYLYWSSSPFRDGKYKDIQYKKDILNNSLITVEERIFYPDEYDEALHRRVIDEN